MWLKSDCALSYLKIRVFVAQFKVFKSNGNHSTYDSYHLPTIKRKKVGGVRFLAKAIAIYFSKKTEFDKINKDRGNELVYFWLANY